MLSLSLSLSLSQSSAVLAQVISLPCRHSLSDAFISLSHLPLSHLSPVTSFSHAHHHPPLRRPAPVACVSVACSSRNSSCMFAPERAKLACKHACGSSVHCVERASQRSDLIVASRSVHIIQGQHAEAHLRDTGARAT